jgi:hypothetical protein
MPACAGMTNTAAAELLLAALPEPARERLFPYLRRSISWPRQLDWTGRARYLATQEIDGVDVVVM